MRATTLPNSTLTPKRPIITLALSLARKLPDDEQGEILATLHGKRGANNMALSRFGDSIDDFVKMLKYQEVQNSPEEAGCTVAMATSLFFLIASTKWKPVPIRHCGGSEEGRQRNAATGHDGFDGVETCSLR